MYTITHKDIIKGINDYNIGLNDNLEHILNNLNLSTKTNNDAYYITSNVTLPYSRVDEEVDTLYYQYVNIDYHRLWYDSYINHKHIILDSNVPEEYIINDTANGFKLIDSEKEFVDRDDSSILYVVDIPLNDAITELTLDYMSDPSTTTMIEIRNDPDYKKLPKNLLQLYSIALRTFQYDDNYIQLIPYLHNMLLTIIYTEDYAPQLSLNVTKDFNIAKDYIDSQSNANMNVITQVDELSKYLDRFELQSVQEHIMDLVTSIIFLRIDHNSILGLWKSITTGHKIDSNASAGNVFHMTILGKIDILVKTAKRTGHITDDWIAQTHEAYIGLRMNELRSIIPNFMYTYGLDYVTPPYTNRTNEVILWDDSQTGVQFPNIFLEYIDGVSLTSVIDAFLDGSDTASIDKKLSPAESTIVLLTQLALALHTAYIKNGFIHNDLHTNNILVRRLDEPVLIEYNYNGRRIPIYTRHMIMVIDYGESSVRDVESNEYVVSPYIVYNYTEGNPLADILNTYMITLGRYSSNIIEYNILFNIFYQAFNNDMSNIELVESQVKLFLVMLPNSLHIPPGKTPGLEIDVDKFYSTLLDTYANLQLHTTRVLDIDHKIRLQPQNIFKIDNLQDVILWDWIVQQDLLTDVSEEMSKDIKKQVVVDINVLYNNILKDCLEYRRSSQSYNIVDCLNSIPNDILTKDKVSIFNLSYIANVIIAYQYIHVLCANNTIHESLCVRNDLLKSTLTRIDLQGFIDMYMQSYYYQYNTYSQHNSIFIVDQVIDVNPLEMFNTDIAKPFILNIFNVNELLK